MHAAPRLTDAQKKANHIESERKRREAIRRGFDALAEIVPGMTGQARSEAVMLQATVSYLSDLLERKAEMRKVAYARGITKEQFEAVYEAVIPAALAAQGSSASPNTPTSSQKKGKAAV